MFSIDDLRQTRFYQEVLQEGREEGREEGKLEAIAPLRELGLSDEKIAAVLGLSLERVQSSGAAGSGTEGTGGNFSEAEDNRLN